MRVGGVGGIGGRRERNVLHKPYIYTYDKLESPIHPHSSAIIDFKLKKKCWEVVMHSGLRTF